MDRRPEPAQLVAREALILTPKENSGHLPGSLGFFWMVDSMDRV